MEDIDQVTINHSTGSISFGLSLSGVFNADTNGLELSVEEFVELHNTLAFMYEMLTATKVIDESKSSYVKFNQLMSSKEQSE